jgi:flagellar M-ring protein FliF
MEELRTRYTAARERFDALPPSARWSIVAGVLVTLAVAAFSLFRDAEPAYALLYANLEEADAGAVVERLREKQVPFKLERAGTQVWVPEASVHETRLALAAEGLPRGGGVGFEIFDEQRFGESEFAEQVKYHRALEGELSRTIGHLAGVESARVHLVLPQRNLFASDESQATASVVVKLRPGARLADERVRGVVHLVASSVRGLQPENVTVVDGDGRPLAGGEQAEDELATRSLDVRRSFEHSKERAVQQLLDATLGPGVAVVRVAAEMTFAREERTEERFDPSTIATRSFQITEERNGAAGPTAEGVPGTPSNLPGGEAPTTGTTENDGLSRRSETRNYEVSKVTTRAIEPVGRVTRLDVAVVVDGTWTGTGAQRRYRARPAEELTRIRTIVESAIGSQADRGDRVTVENVQFAAVPAAAAEPAADAVQTFVKQNGLYLGIGLAVLLAIAVALFVMRRRKKKAEQAPAAGDAAGLVLASGDGGAMADALGGPVSVAVDAQPIGDRPTPTPAGGVKTPLLASDIVREDPNLAAHIVRGWLSEAV